MKVLTPQPIDVMSSSGMILADLPALRRPLDSSILAGDLIWRIDALVEDLIGASIAQDAYMQTRLRLANLPEPHSLDFDYASRTPHVFAQAWVRSLRDIATGLRVLTSDKKASLAARRAVAAFDLVFPGVGTAEGPMRVMVAGKDHVYFAIDELRVAVRINDAAVRDLEAIALTLVEGLVKAKPFRSVG